MGISSRGYLPSCVSFPASKLDGTTGDLEVRSDGSVICHRPMLIDLGGIAKGYAVDRACDVLLAEGAKNILTNAGGDLRTAAGPTVEIVIRNQRGRTVDRVLVNNGALASSDNSRSRRRLLVLTATGYLLYYAGNQQLRESASAIHWILGLGSPAIFLWHRAGRRKDDIPSSK